MYILQLHRNSKTFSAPVLRSQFCNRLTADYEKDFTKIFPGAGRNFCTFPSSLNATPNIAEIGLYYVIFCLTRLKMDNFGGPGPLGQSDAPSVWYS